MAWRPTEAGPKTIRELYYWAWQNFVSNGKQLGDVPGENPGHTHSHPNLTNRDAVDSHPIAAVTDLQSTLDAKVSEGYGGILNGANTVIADLNGSWITLPVDTASVASPVNVVQELATNSISIDAVGVWLITMSGTLLHNEVNAGRVMGVRLHNLTKALSPYVLGVPTGRNSPGTAFSYSFLVDIDLTNVTDNFVVEVGGPGDTYTGVTVTEFTFDAVHVAADGGTAPSPSGGGRQLIESITDPVTGEFDFTAIPQTFSRVQVVGNIRSTEAATSDEVHMFFNDDNVLGNYSFQDLFGNGGVADGSDGFLPRVGSVTGADGEGASPLSVFIEGYAGSELKSTMGSSSEFRQPGEQRIHQTCMYHDTLTAPITRLRVRSASGFDLTGTLTLYGEV